MAVFASRVGLEPSGSSLPPPPMISRTPVPSPAATWARAGPMMGQASLWGEQAQEQPADVVAGDGDRLRRPGRGHRLPVEPLEQLVEGGPGVAAAEQADLLVGGAGL